MGKLKASEKLERLLSMIPWIMDNDGPSLNSIAHRFEYPEELLLDDLTKVLFMVGPYPHTPDTLIEVIIEDGRVWIDQAEWLARPIRLTPEQGFSLLRKAKTLEIFHGENTWRDLSRAIEKLEKALGQSSETFEVDIPELRNADWSVIHHSIETETQLTISYYSYSADETSIRNVHPVEILNRDSNHYLYAYCDTANDYRLFRFDRILNADPSSDPNCVPKGSRKESTDDDSWDLGGEESLVTIKIQTSDSWILSTYPIQDVSHSEDGSIEVKLLVTGIAWLQRLLIRLSPETVILEAPDHIPHDLAKRTAQAISGRYKENS